MEFFLSEGWTLRVRIYRGLVVFSSPSGKNQRRCTQFMSLPLGFHHADDTTASPNMKYVDTWMKSIWILGDRKNLEKPWYRNVQYDVTSTTMINHVSPVIFQYPIIFGYRKTAICGRDRRNSGTIASFASSSQPGLT